MGTAGENKPIAIPTSKGNESTNGDISKKRARTPTPPLNKKVLVFDCEHKTISVQQEKDVVKHPGDFEKVPLPAHENEVTIFVDPQTESIATTKNETEDGHSNIMIAKLYLDRLSTFNRLLRVLGKLSYLYITNINPWSESSSVAHKLSSSTSLQNGELV
ncbi:hypothetical protein MMC30_006778 [Trapelia coarctata]|nr:hypothetical protein [Trapelia coarctata]